MGLYDSLPALDHQGADGTAMNGGLLAKSYNSRVQGLCEPPRRHRETSIHSR